MHVAFHAPSLTRYARSKLRYHAVRSQATRTIIGAPIAPFPHTGRAVNCAWPSRRSAPPRGMCGRWRSPPASKARGAAVRFMLKEM